MKKVYLAGPDVFLPNVHVVAASLKTVCAQYDLEGVFPLDANVGEHTDSKEMAHSIFKANVELINGCQGVLANMFPFRGPSTDVGTAWEMGYAHGRGLPVVGYLNGFDIKYHEKVEMARSVRKEGSGLIGMDPEMVEDFGLYDNLMLDCSVDSVHTFFAGAAFRMRELLGQLSDLGRVRRLQGMIQFCVALIVMLSKDLDAALEATHEFIPDVGGKKAYLALVSDAWATKLERGHKPSLMLN